MSKEIHLCKWDKKEIAKKSGELIKILKKSKYYCLNCARTAITDQVLCKPLRINRKKQKSKKLVKKEYVSEQTT